MALAETGGGSARRWRRAAGARRRSTCPVTPATCAATARSTSTRSSDGVAARLDGPVDLLVGHSLGAIVALGLLARDPDAARAVVLEEPPGAASRSTWRRSPP